MSRELNFSSLSSKKTEVRDFGIVSIIFWSLFITAMGKGSSYSFAINPEKICKYNESLSGKAFLKV